MRQGTLRHRPEVDLTTPTSGTAVRSFRFRRRFSRLLSQLESRNYTGALRSTRPFWGFDLRFVPPLVGGIWGGKVSTSEFSATAAAKTAEAFSIKFTVSVDVTKDHLLAKFNRNRYSGNGVMGGRKWGFSGFHAYSSCRISVAMTILFNFMYPSHRPHRGLN